MLLPRPSAVRAPCSPRRLPQGPQGGGRQPEVVRHSAARRRIRGHWPRGTTPIRRWTRAAAPAGCAVSPIASTTYGGVSGRPLIWMARPVLRMPPSAVSRWSLIAIASAPAFHRPSTSSGEVLVADLVVGVGARAALATLMRTPGPRTGTKPVRTSSRRSRAAGRRTARPACRWCPRRRSAASVRVRISLCRSATSARPDSIWRIRVARPSSWTSASREVWTATMVASAPKAATATAVLPEPRPGGADLAVGGRAAARRGRSPRRASVR